MVILAYIAATLSGKKDRRSMCYHIASGLLLIMVFLDFISIAFLRETFYFDILRFSLAAVSFFVFLYDAILSYLEGSDIVLKSDTLLKKSYFDDLSGLGSANAYELYKASLDGKFNTFYIALFDLDKLKMLNDRFGHDRGDEAIKTFGEIVRSEQDGESDVSFRIGGDEFVLISRSVEYRSGYAKRVASSYFDRTGETVSYADGFFSINGKESFDFSFSILDSELLEKKRANDDEKE